MTPDDLEEAVRRFQSEGGKVQVLAGFSGVVSERARKVDPVAAPKKIKAPKEYCYPEHLVESVRAFSGKGLSIAAKALHMDTRTIKRIAELNGILFTTDTHANNAEKWKSREALSVQIREMSDAGVSQSKIGKALGITRWVLRGIAEKHQININSSEQKRSQQKLEK